MSRAITPATSLDTLKKEAKRWLKGLRAGDSEARARFERVLRPTPVKPGLRDVQHALAREHGHEGWAALKQAVQAAPAAIAFTAETLGRGLHPSVGRSGPGVQHAGSSRRSAAQ